MAPTAHTAIDAIDAVDHVEGALDVGGRELAATECGFEPSHSAPSRSLGSVSFHTAAWPAHS